MAYTKRDPKGWVQSLKSGAYDSGSAAKKSVGRMSWSMPAKELAREMIDKYFVDGKVTDASIKTLESLVPGEPAAAPVRPRRTPKCEEKGKRGRPPSKLNGASKKRQPCNQVYLTDTGMPATRPEIPDSFTIPAPFSMEEVTYDVLTRLKLCTDILAAQLSVSCEAYETLALIEKNEHGDSSYIIPIVASLPALIENLRLLQKVVQAESEKLLPPHMPPPNVVELFDKTRPKDPFTPSVS